MGVAPIPTAAVVADKAVFSHTQELEQTSIKELRFRMRDIGPFFDLQLERGHVVQANWKMELRNHMVQLNPFEVVLCLLMQLPGVNLFEIVNIDVVFKLRRIEIPVTLSTWCKVLANCVTSRGYKTLIDNCRRLLSSRAISRHSKCLFQLGLLLVQ